MHGKIIKLKTSYGHYISAFEGELITRKILRNGIYDGASLSYILSLLKKMSEATVLDVGANIGNHALCFAIEAKTVFCFEPIKEVYSLLVNNVSANRLDNITCINEALSDQAGERVFFINRQGNLGASSFEQHRDSVHAERVMMKMRVGDDMVAKLGIDKIDLIKIDVEGHELAVLKGLARSIARHKPFIVMEWNDEAAVRSLRKASIFSDLLKDYKAFVLGSSFDRSYWANKPLGKIRRRLTRAFTRKQACLYSFDPERLYRNILLVPPGKDSFLP